MFRFLLCLALLAVQWFGFVDAAFAAPVVVDDALDDIASAIEACTAIGGAGLIVLVLVRALRILRESVQ